MILNKFKNIVNLNNAPEKEANKNGDENENKDPNAQIPPEQSLDETNDKTFFDDMLGAPQYTYEEFIKILKTPQEERGDTEDLKKHWGHPRRWKVILWDIQIQNYMNNDFNAFVDFDFGGDREECRIQRGSKMKIYTKGKSKNCLRTQVVCNVRAEQKKEIKFKKVFEYRGSYLDLENEKLRIKVWEYKKFTLNKLEGIYEEPLLSFAIGQVYNETTLYKFIKNSRVKRCQLFFQLYFQELYDFELSFLNWSFSDLLSHTYIQEKSLNYLENPDTIEKRHIDKSQCSIFPKMCKPRKKLNKNNKKNKKKRLGDNINEKFSFNTVLSNESNEHSSNNANSGTLAGKNKSEMVSKNLEKLFFRNLSLLNNIEENEDISYQNLENVKLPNPRVTMKLIHTPKGNDGFTIVSMCQKNVRYPMWENLGEIYFRGTLRDLDVSYLSVKVEDMSAPKDAREIGVCQIPLKGIVDYPHIMHELEASPWIIEEAKCEGWDKKLKEWKFGKLEGKVIVGRVPRYRQIGDIYHIDNKHVYLIVHILNIDQIVTVDNIKELDSYVEVSFDETSRRTKIVKKSLTPNYDSHIAIPLRFNNKNEMDYENFSKKGCIYIDVWGKTDDIIYIGGISITPYEIFYNEKNARRKKTKLEHTDLETNIKTNYETVVYKGCKKLHFLHDDQRLSNLNFSIWTYPDLLSNEGTTNTTTTTTTTNKDTRICSPPVFNTTNNFPLKLAQKYDKLKNLYFQVLKAIKGIPESCTDISKAKRFFNYELLNQRKENHFLPTLITNIKSPYFYESERAIFHYVRCIPFIHKKENLVFTPDFTLQLKGGNALDHSLLLCSLFLGIPVISFVCFGTLLDNQKHAWVATLEFNEHKNYGVIKFWETTTGNVYTLKKRFLDINKLKSLKIQLSESKHKLHLRDDFLHRNGTQKDSDAIKEQTKRYIKELFQNRSRDAPPNGPSLPYKTIDLIFNNTNIYVNLQDADPLNIWYDYWKFDYWFPFSSIQYNIQPCFTIKTFSHKIEDMELDRLAKDLRTNIEKNINIYRASRNLSTRWNKDETLELFLQVGLELLHQLNTSRKDDERLAKVKIDDWKKALYHKVPQSHRLLGFPYHFNTCKSKFITDKLISTLAILESRDKSLCLSLAVCLYSLPGGFISVYIYIITCVKITQREMRKIEITKEKAQRKTKLKNLKKKDHNNNNADTQSGGEAEDMNNIQNDNDGILTNFEETLKDDPYYENEQNSNTNKSSFENLYKNEENASEIGLNKENQNEENENYSRNGDRKKKLQKSVDIINILLEMKNRKKNEKIGKDGKRNKSEENNEQSLIGDKNNILNKIDNEVSMQSKEKDLDQTLIDDNIKTKDKDETKKKKKSKSRRKDKDLEYEKLMISNAYLEQERKRLQEDMEKLKLEKEEIRLQKVIENEDANQKLIEENRKLKKELLENDKLERKVSFMLKVSEWEKKENERKKQQEESYKQMMEEAKLNESKEKQNKSKEKAREKENDKENEKVKKKKKKHRDEDNKEKTKITKGDKQKKSNSKNKKEIIPEVKDDETNLTKEINYGEKTKEIDQENQKSYIALESQIKNEVSDQSNDSFDSKMHDKNGKQHEKGYINLTSFDENLDLNKIYRNNSGFGYTKEKKRNTIKVHTTRKIYNDNKPDDIEYPDINDNTNEENIARYLYDKNISHDIQKTYYNDKPHYGNDRKNISYKEIKDYDLFKGFIEETKKKKKIVLVKKP
ncbi:double C2-like domain-containing protein, putative [Plasmodium yoelii]|uniref:Double C2-like domain-containing protein n=2 Tax=Plasmodium yoelii TaxID=5861 RepID=A0AAE9WZA8_PLAYO|nr:double C2-like domain-containing protein, putative [Plasmodium yoelii]WBY61235.1 double C2-like domain-containing protein [Plasmodium yoelii yoelii]CDU20941.1 double C2-like domain-containing protein, putative [Plasmodium yoelii]VTZ81907.1 double C2-like domain-containing protein, putative [Plasmodium yoelii]|eukprot:XP_022813043.1 double C2-like domain-containing protein, putative [Plasmodium yoelii]